MQRLNVLYRTAMAYWITVQYMQKDQLYSQKLRRKKAILLAVFVKLNCSIVIKGNKVSVVDAKIIFGWKKNGGRQSKNSLCVFVLTAKNDISLEYETQLEGIATVSYVHLFMNICPIKYRILKGSLNVNPHQSETRLYASCLMLNNVVF